MMETLKIEYDNRGNGGFDEWWNIISSEDGTLGKAYSEGDARLWAAAPALLEAVEATLLAIDAFPHGKQRTPLGRPNGGLARKLRAAKAKAEGKS